MKFWYNEKTSTPVNRGFPKAHCQSLFVVVVVFELIFNNTSHQREI